MPTGLMMPRPVTTTRFVIW
jgi:hypothetical protein